MAKLSAEVKDQIKKAVRNPVAWWKGAGLPEETLRPWEGGIQFLAEMLKGFMHGFVTIRNRIYTGMAEGKVPPLLKSISDVTNITWDALNDPLIGLHMDRKRYGAQAHRWVMRFNATLSPLLILIQCFNFGLTPVQRMIEWMVIGIFADFISTANAVSETKIWAGITPHSEQRGQLQMFRSLGGTVGALFTGIPFIFMGLKDALGVTDYQIMIFGVVIFAPLTIISRWLPSYAKQRVDFTVKVNAEGEAISDGPKEEKLTLRETLSIVKYNRWFIMWTIIWFIRVFTPDVDKMFLYRFLIPKMELSGIKFGGEILFTAKNIIFGWPSLVLSPLAVEAMKKLRGPINFIRIDIAVIIFTHLTSFLVGYKSLPRLIYLWTMEGLENIMANWRGVPHNIVQHQMFDYVEWKTGYRSEGLTAAVDGMFNKIIKNNLGAFVSNAIVQWTQYQGWDIPVERQPARFINTIWPLMHLGIVAGEIIALAFMLWFKYPHDPKEVEADLIERRALAQKLKEEAKV